MRTGRVQSTMHWATSPLKWNWRAAESIWKSLPKGKLYPFRDINPCHSDNGQTLLSYPGSYKRQVSRDIFSFIFYSYYITTYGSKIISDITDRIGFNDGGSHYLVWITFETRTCRIQRNYSATVRFHQTMEQVHYHTQTHILHKFSFSHIFMVQRNVRLPSQLSLQIVDEARVCHKPLYRLDKRLWSSTS
jgi:hypothetical protein